MKTILYFQSSTCASNRAKLDGALRFARSFGWHIAVILFGEAARSHLQQRCEKPKIRALARFWKAEGAIVDCGGAPNELNVRDFGRLPVVFLDKKCAGSAPCVASDSVAIAELAAHELLMADCAAYGFVPWLKPLNWSLERGREFAARIRLNNKAFVPFPRQEAPDNRLVERICAWLRDAPKPFGVFAANDYIASLVLTAAAAGGLTVPDEVSVVGVDDDRQLCTQTTTPLTSIRPDHERAGFMAAELLNERMQHPQRKAETLRLFGPADIVRRKSVRRTTGRNLDVAAVIDLIRQKACTGLSAREVLATMHGSRRCAELRFREQTGRSILEEIRSVRLETAMSLLRNTDLTVAETARKCGYGAAEPLRKMFVDTFGKSPRAWRRGVRHGSITG
ncbi:MAG: substrate-binding domain-containing protein [Kiritimatiellia bacterium]